MGGALAQLASLDIKRREPAAGDVCCWGCEVAHLDAAGGLLRRPRVHRTYTFAAPRVGDANFAALFDRTFALAEDHWALQAPSDAVPHLPFKAWGFEHPRGVLKLAEPTPGDAASRSAIQMATDRGDSVDFLRPLEGKPLSWASCHDITEYSAHLRSMLEREAAQLSTESDLPNLDLPNLDDGPAELHAPAYVEPAGGRTGLSAAFA